MIIDLNNLNLFFIILLITFIAGYSTGRITETKRLLKEYRKLESTIEILNHCVIKHINERFLK